MASTASVQATVEMLRALHQDLQNARARLQASSRRMRAQLEAPEEPEELEQQEQQEEPNEPGEPVAPLPPVVPGEPREREPLPPVEQINSHIRAVNFVHGHALVNVSDLPVEERICFICRMEYFESVHGTTTEIHARMDPQNINEHSEELCVPTKLQCGHIVGHRCIRLWINNSLRNGVDARCPICRVIIRGRSSITYPSWLPTSLLPGLEE